MQEISVRSAKGFSAALSVAGSVLAFTPAMPLGVGLMVGGAGVGLTTATGDAIGSFVQKLSVESGLAELRDAEAHVCEHLDCLVTTFFPGTDAAEWEAARGARLVILAQPRVSPRARASRAGAPRTAFLFIAASASNPIAHHRVTTA